jgi:hypothetical protein
MISETLNACLIAKSRKHHELYLNDKMSLLYSTVLADDGLAGNI